MVEFLLFFIVYSYMIIQNVCLRDFDNNLYKNFLKSYNSMKININLFKKIFNMTLRNLNIEY